MTRRLLVLALLPGWALAELRVRVPEYVQERKLIKRVEPKSPHHCCIQGRVRFNATIGKDGTVQELSLISGHPILVGLAIAAVRQWRYRPTYIRRRRVAVVTIITVTSPPEKREPKRSSRAA